MSSWACEVATVFGFHNRAAHANRGLCKITPYHGSSEIWSYVALLLSLGTGKPLRQELRMLAPPHSAGYQLKSHAEGVAEYLAPWPPGCLTASLHGFMAFLPSMRSMRTFRILSSHSMPPASRMALTWRPWLKCALLSSRPRPSFGQFELNSHY